MRKLRDYIEFIENSHHLDVERREKFGNEEYVYTYATNFFLIFQTFSTKIYLHYLHDELPNQKIIYDPGMNHLIFDEDEGSEIQKFKGISKYCNDDAYAFQQSLVQELLFEIEDLQELFRLHQELDKLHNPHKYHKEPECTFLNSSISFVKNLFSN